MREPDHTVSVLPWELEQVRRSIEIQDAGAARATERLRAASIAYAKAWDELRDAAKAVTHYSGEQRAFLPTTIAVTYQHKDD